MSMTLSQVLLLVGKLDDSLGDELQEKDSAIRLWFMGSSRSNLCFVVSPNVKTALPLSYTTSTALARGFSRRNLG